MQVPFLRNWKNWRLTNPWKIGKFCPRNNRSGRPVLADGKCSKITRKKCCNSDNGELTEDMFTRETMKEEMSTNVKPEKAGSVNLFLHAYLIIPLGSRIWTRIDKDGKVNVWILMKQVSTQYGNTDIKPQRCFSHLIIIHPEHCACLTFSLCVQICLHQNTIWKFNNVLSMFVLPIFDMMRALKAVMCSQSDTSLAVSYARIYVCAEGMKKKKQNTTAVSCSSYKVNWNDV